MAYKDKEKERLWRKEYLKKYRKTEKFMNYKELYLQKSKEQRKKWAKDYYDKNKLELLVKHTAYRKANPDVTKKTQAKCRDKNMLRSRKDRVMLSDFYVSDLIKDKLSRIGINMTSAEIRKDKQLMKDYKNIVELYRLIKTHNKNEKHYKEKI